MNDISVFIYLVFCVMLFASTFAFMWRMMSSTLKEMNKPTKTVKLPAPHPEMEGVKYGEELLIYTPEKEEELD